MTYRMLAVAVISLGVALPAAAQQSVNLTFNNGRVTLSARNMPVRAILAEWARLGGATVVNGDRVGGAPVTLELRDVPESVAIDVLLRGVAGYMIAPRPVGSRAASAFDRILILASSTAPANVAPATSAPARPGVPRPPFPRPQPINEAPPDPTDTDPTGDNPTEAEQPENIGQPGPPLPGNPRVVRPPIVADPREDDAPEEDPVDAPGEVAPTPSNPFGIPAGSSAVPGVVTPVGPRPGQRPGPTRVQ